MRAWASGFQGVGIFNEKTLPTARVDFHTRRLVRVFLVCDLVFERVMGFWRCLAADIQLADPVVGASSFWPLDTAAGRSEVAERIRSSSTFHAIAPDGPKALDHLGIVFKWF